MVDASAVFQSVQFSVNYSEPCAIQKALRLIEEHSIVQCQVEYDLFPVPIGQGVVRRNVEEINLNSHFVTSVLIAKIGPRLADPLTMLRYLVEQTPYERQIENTSLSTVFQNFGNLYRITMNKFNHQSQLCICPCSEEYLWDKRDSFLGVQ